LKRALPPLLALFVGALTLAFTVGLCVHERASEQARLRAVFDANARQAAGRIEQRIANYEQMLRGVQGLFGAADAVDSAAFGRYVDAVMAGPDAAGLQSVAYSALLTPADLARHVQRMRESGHVGYAVEPPGARDLYAPVEMMAPDTPTNRRVIGFDSLSDPQRRVAMMQARESGNPVLTGLIQLRASAADDLKPGCVLYLPVYARHAAIDTVAQRRA
jgi:CHASE1-domain containing sensor protein